MRKTLQSSAALYDRLIKRGYVELGSGCFSVVLAKPGSDKVIKINRRADGWLNYVLWAAKHGYAGNHAPRVYSYHRFEDDTYVAVVERMDMTLYEVRKNEDPRYQAWQSIHRASYTHVSPEDQAQAEQTFPGASEFVRTLKREFSGSTDLHDENYMLRPDGSLCCTDPIAYSRSRETTPNRMRSRDLQAMAA